jgi:hypothetical protein
VEIEVTQAFATGKINWYGHEFARASNHNKNAVFYAPTTRGQPWFQAGGISGHGIGRFSIEVTATFATQRLNGLWLCFRLRAHVAAKAYQAQIS